MDIDLLRVCLIFVGSSHKEIFFSEIWFISQSGREDVTLVSKYLQQQIFFKRISVYEKRPGTKAKNLVLGNNQSALMEYLYTLYI